MTSITGTRVLSCVRSKHLQLEYATDGLQSKARDGAGENNDVLFSVTPFHTDGRSQPVRITATAAMSLQPFLQRSIAGPF